MPGKGGDGSGRAQPCPPVVPIMACVSPAPWLFPSPWRWLGTGRRQFLCARMCPRASPVIPRSPWQYSWLALLYSLEIGLSAPGFALVKGPCLWLSCCHLRCHPGNAFPSPGDSVQMGTAWQGCCPNHRQCQGNCTSNYLPNLGGHQAFLLVLVPTFADLLLSGQG